MAVISNFRGNNEIDREIISLLPSIGMDEMFLIENVPYPTSQLAFYSYAAIYYNLSTPSGWMIQGVDAQYLEKFGKIRNAIKDGNCNILYSNLNVVNATKLITYRDYCDKMQDCGMALVKETENMCLLDII